MKMLPTLAVVVPLVIVVGAAFSKLVGAGAYEVPTAPPVEDAPPPAIEVATVRVEAPRDPRAEIEVPLRLSERLINCTKLESIEPPPFFRTENGTYLRNEFSGTRDDVLGRFRWTLAVVDRFDTYVIDRPAELLGRDSSFWYFRCEVDDSGTSSTFIKYVAEWSREWYGLGATGGMDPQRFELLFRGANGVEKRACAVAAQSKGAISRWIDEVEFAVSAADMLAIADAASCRLSYPESHRDLTLNQFDVESIRWFVWDNVPGGQDLIRSRYTLVERGSSAK